MSKKPRRASDNDVNAILSKAPIENIVESFYNAFLEANIRARADAGIKEMVIREALGGCCPWCQELAGIYEYGTEPKDIFKRHDNCTCIVTFRTEEGYTDVWTEKKFETELEARIARVEELERRSKLRKKYDRLHRIAEDEGRSFSTEADPDDFEFMSNSFRPKFGKTRDLTGNFGTDKVPRNEILKLKYVQNSEFDLYVDDDFSKRTKAIRLVEKNLRALKEELPVGIMRMPKVIVMDFEKYGIGKDVIAAYHKELECIFINSRYDTVEKVQKFLEKKKGFFASTDILSLYRHELGHYLYQELIKKIAKKNNLPYNVFDENNPAKKILDAFIADFVHEKNSENRFVKKELGMYALDGYQNHEYTEILAECFAGRFERKYAQELLKRLEEWLL